MAGLRLYQRSGYKVGATKEHSMSLNDAIDYRRPALQHCHLDALEASIMDALCREALMNGLLVTLADIQEDADNGDDQNLTIAARAGRAGVNLRNATPTQTTPVPCQRLQRWLARFRAIVKNSPRPWVAPQGAGRAMCGASARGFRGCYRIRRRSRRHRARAPRSCIRADKERLKKPFLIIAVGASSGRGVNLPG